MVLSGKGGVGKSTVSTGLALSLAQQGHKVGILDIDITGPNVPKMMGLDGRRLHVEEGRIHPAQGHLGVKVISMAFLLDDDDTPVVWRGPTKPGAIQQFIGDVEWGDLDYLVIDFPPGTSDEPLTVAQSLPDIDGWSSHHPSGRGLARQQEIHWLAESSRFLCSVWSRT